MKNTSNRPLLTIAVPTYHRVHLLKRCLDSFAGGYSGDEIELVVSDNSTEPDTEQLVVQYAPRWGRSLRYFNNAEGTGAVQNFNLCYQRARGRYTLILHDDDYLLPGAVETMLQVIRDVNQQRDQVLLFGVRVEELSGRVRRRQYSRSDIYLPPARALYQLLGDSSYVRWPGLVVRTEAYAAVGGFRLDAYTTCDLDIEVRLFGRYGLRRLPVMTAAYTVHSGGITTTVFNPRTIALADKIFNHARQLDILDDTTITECQRRFFHQFILAGAWRALRRGDRATARDVLSLLQLPRVKALGVSQRWLLARVVFSVLALSFWPKRWRRSRKHAGHDFAAVCHGNPDRSVSRSKSEW